MKIKRFRYALAATAVLMGTAGIIGQGALAQADAGGALAQVQPNDEMLKTGETLFQANCVACHGTQGKGDGLSAAALNPPPRNFHAKDNWKNSPSFAGMYKTLEEGIPGGAMGAYTQFSAQERVALINYVRSLAPEVYPEVTASDIEKLEKDYDLSAALAKKVEKNILPIDVAMQKLVEENQPKVNKVKAAHDKVMQASSADAAFFKASVYNARRALTMLNNDGLWKSSPAELSKVVMSNLGHNGFDSSVGAYSAQDWQKLQGYLKTLL